MAGIDFPEHNSDILKMKTTTIRQVATFSASTLEVYELLMDEKKHSAFTGSEVRMSTKPKGSFTVFDGYCHGYNIELVKGEKIVQAWHFAEDGWPDDHFSTCTFLLEPSGGKTKLTFVQRDVPSHKAEALKQGWKEYYWQSIKAYLKK